MAVIKSPNQEYTGTSAGVYFVNGVGNTDNENLIEWFRDRGYEVEIPEVEEETEDVLAEEETEDVLAEEEIEEPNKKSNKSKK